MVRPVVSLASDMTRCMAGAALLADGSLCVNPE